MDVILHFHDAAGKMIDEGVPCVRMTDLEVLSHIIRMKTDISCADAAKVSKLKDEIDYVLKGLKQ
jgi:hypothetical protein